VFAVTVSVDVLVSAIAVCCILVSVVTNLRLRPLPATALATLINLALYILIYSSPRLANEGWRGFADDISHPLYWTVALVVGAFWAGLVTGLFVVVRLFCRAP
jgi:hypothetical protein